MGNPEINLIVTDVITEDVEKGIQLYGLATGELDSASVERTQRWLSLFRDNPFGGGLFAIAKRKNEVVGFYSIIDIEMVVRGRLIRAGKAEFFFVKEELRKFVIPGTERPLPWILFQRLRDEANGYGYEVILSVPSLTASLFHRFSGDLRIKTRLVTLKLPDQANKRFGRIGRYAARLLRSRRLAVTRCRLHHFAKGNRVNEVDQIEATPGNLSYISDSVLISSSKRMVNLRFPSQKYIKYLLDVPGESAVLFVFDRPAHRSSVNLVHWSGLPRSFELFATVLVAIIDRVRKEGARELVIELPVNQLPESYRLEECGFIKHGERNDFDTYLMDATKELDLKAVSNWHVTHGHKGFYSWRT